MLASWYFFQKQSVCLSLTLTTDADCCAAPLCCVVDVLPFHCCFCFFPWLTCIQLLSLSLLLAALCSSVFYGDVFTVFAGWFLLLAFVSPVFCCGHCTTCCTAPPPAMPMPSTAATVDCCYLQFFLLFYDAIAAPVTTTRCTMLQHCDAESTSTTSYIPPHHFA